MPTNMCSGMTRRMFGFLIKIYAVWAQHYEQHQDRTSASDWLEVTPSHQHAHMSRALQDSQQTTQDSRPCQPGLVFEQRSICPAQTSLPADYMATYAALESVEWSGVVSNVLTLIWHVTRSALDNTLTTWPAGQTTAGVCTVEMDKRYDIKWLPVMHSRNAPTTTALRFTEFRQRADRIDRSATAKSFTTETS